MNIRDLVMNAGNGANVRALSTQLGLSETQTTSALSALMPALASGVQRNVQSPDGLAGLTSALSSGKHQRYIEDLRGRASAGPVAREQDAAPRAERVDQGAARSVNSNGRGFSWTRSTA